MEKTIKPLRGVIMAIFELIVLVIIIFCFINLTFVVAGILLSVLLIILLKGFIIVNPNAAYAFTLFGKYSGTLKDNGFFWLNPFYSRIYISIRARSLETALIKVNDKQGNPVMIGAVIVWMVDNVYKAAFDVQYYEQFVKTQSESAIRKLAGSYSYDNTEDAGADITLRSNADEVNHLLEKEISDRLTIAGIKIIEARISYLAYAEEIAGAMLQRQQASAIVAARSKIVEGAVGMVEMALEQLSQKSIVNLDEEKKAAMVSNLMVVLCADKAATPVLNTGTLHQ